MKSWMPAIIEKTTRRCIKNCQLQFPKELLKNGRFEIFYQSVTILWKVRVCFVDTQGYVLWTLILEYPEIFYKKHRARLWGRREFPKNPNLCVFYNTPLKGECAMRTGATPPLFLQYPLVHSRSGEASVVPVGNETKPRSGAMNKHKVREVSQG